MTISAPCRAGGAPGAPPFPDTPIHSACQGWAPKAVNTNAPETALINIGFFIMVAFVFFFV